MGQPPRNRQGSDPLPQQPPVVDFLKSLSVCCFLLLLVLVVFQRTSQHDFIICDDDVYIYRNPHAAGGLTWENVKWSFTGVYAGNWHPLTWLSHMLDCEIYRSQSYPNGQYPGGHHLTSLLLHAISSVVLFLAMRRMTGAFWCSALVAAMFALHPLQVESVAWAAQRKSVLCGLFWMLTLLAYGGYVLRPNIWRYLAVVAVFGLGLTAKSMLVTLPCVLLLLDFWPLRRWRPSWICPATTEQTPPRFASQSFRWLVVEKLPLMALSVGVCVIIAIIQHDMGAMTMVDMHNMTLAARIANAAISAVAYLWSTIWPVNLTFFYPHPVVLQDYSATRFMLQGIAAGGLLLAISALALWNLRRRPYLAVGWFWYLGTLVPVIGLVQVGAQGRADRYVYLPLIGVSIMLVWGAAELAAKSSRRRVATGVAAGLVLASWTVVTVNQVSYWKDSETLFTQAIRATDNNFFAYNHLGLVYATAGDSAKAEEEYLKAVDIAPSYDAANANLGACYANSKPPDLDNAIRYFQAAVDVNPHNAGHRCNLGAMYRQQGKYDEAEATFRGALEVDPNDLHSLDLLAGLLYVEGRSSEALVEWKKILDMWPDHVIILNTVARILATHPDASLRDGEEAVKLAERAVELTKGQAPEYLDTLAAAYAETGQFPLAIETADKAAKLALRYNSPNLAKLIRAQILFFEDGKPWREQPPALKKPSPSPQDRR